MAAKILISLPQEFLDNVDRAAAEEHRSRSELIREALRSYLETRQEKKLRVKTIQEERVAYQTEMRALPDVSLEATMARAPEQQTKIAKTIALQDEIARKMQHVKTDSTEEIRRWRTTRKGV
jgi:metal-responsive CopG/Arc/MetJ family transcriptional regulator